MCIISAGSIKKNEKTSTKNQRWSRTKPKCYDSSKFAVRHCWSVGRCTKHCLSASNTASSDVLRVFELLSSNFLGFEPRSRLSSPVSRPSFFISPLTPGMMLSESMWREVDPIMLSENVIAAVILGRNATPSRKKLCVTQVTEFKNLSPTPFS